MHTIRRRKPRPGGGRAAAVVLTAVLALLTGRAAAAVPDYVADTPVVDAADTGAAWTLAACEEYALAHHPARAAAQAGAAEAQAQAGAARAGDYPDLQATGGYRRWESHAFLPPAMARTLPGGTIGPFDDFSAALRGSWLLYDFGQQESVQAAAAARASAATAEVAVTGARLLAGVRLGYYTLLAAQTARDAAWQRLGRANAHLQLAEQRKAAGAVPRADVLRAKVAAAEARLAYVQRAGDVAVARANLNAALGRGAETALRVSTEAPLPAMPTAAERDAVLAAALTARPEVRAATERVAAQRAAVDAARAASRPKLRAEAAGGWRDDEFVPEDEDWSAGVSVSFPLFDGYLRDHQLAQAEAALAQAEAEQERLMLTIRQEISTAYAQCVTAAEAAAATRLLAAEAAESLTVARERYAAGAGTINDLLDAQANLAAAELGLAGSGYNRNLAWVLWQWKTAR